MNNNNNNFANHHDAFKQSIKRLEDYKAHQIVQYYISETIKLSIITGPLYNLSTNLQFLNKNLVEQFGKAPLTGVSESSFKLKGMPTESIIRPFKPSVYANYRDCVFNVYRQGIAGLYKGTFYRLTYFGATNLLKKKLDGYFSSYFRVKRIFKEMILYSIADLILNPLLLIESRYCIQNRRKGFRIYDNAFSVLKLSWKELYNGSLYAIPRNVVFVIGLNTYLLYPSNYMNIFSICLAHVLSYPILTIQRNIMFQSSFTDYLPNSNEMKINFSSFVNNYGFMGLYRGFFAYAFATILWHVYVPNAAKRKLFENMFKKDDTKSMKLNLFEDTEDYEDDIEDNKE
jgi:hypothetical protein